MSPWKQMLLGLGICLGIMSGANAYISHVYLSGYAGSGVLARGDILHPLWQQADRNFFFYGQGNYSYADEDWADNLWTGTAGFGYRQIGNNVVYGFFVLGDYTHTLTDHAIWQISPGLEVLGRAWQFHANAYIPLSKKDWTTTGFADEFGNYDYVRFNGHNQYDAKFRYHEEAGSGADAEIGRTLFKCHNTLVTGLINGYYFLMRNNNSVRGGGASIDVQPTNYLKLFINGSYDNYAHTQVMLGFQVSIYDLFSGKSTVLDTQDLHRKLFDPIERNFANIASGSMTRTTGGPGDRGKPEVITWYEYNAPERTNVWFFNGSSSMLTANGVGSANSIADGTYEHPFTGSNFNQTTVRNIYDFSVANGYEFAYLYFTQGTYNAFTNSAGYSQMEIFPGESLWGRMGANKGFAEPATGTHRALFYGGFQLDSNASVNNIRLQNNSMVNFTTGIILNGATNVGINDSQVGIDGLTGGYKTGVSMANDSSLTISGSNIFGFNNLNTGTPASNGVGLKVTNGGNVTAINHSLIQGHAINGDGMGLYLAPVHTGVNTTSQMGSISGDKTAQFYGIGNDAAGGGYGFYAMSFAGTGVATTQINSVSGSNFSGTGSSGYGFYVESKAPGGSAFAQIGSITYSNFSSVAGDEGYGLYNDAFADSGVATAQINNIGHSNFVGLGGNFGYGLRIQSSAPTTVVQIDKISGSSFSGIGGNDGFGLAADSSYNGSVPGSAAINIGTISDSIFNGKGGINGYGFFSFGSFSDSGSVRASTNIDTISNSGFTGIGGTEGDGFIAQSESQPGRSIIKIDTISDSTFDGTGGLNSYGFHAVSKSFSGLTVIQIGSITGSKFEGTGGDAFGLNIDSEASPGAATVSINSISHSTFLGLAPIKGYGLYAFSFSSSGPSNTKLGSITNSTFSGISGNEGFGLFASSDATLGNATTNLGSVTGNTFNSNYSGVYLYGKTNVQVAGMNFTNPNNLYVYLLNNANIFPGGQSNGPVCINNVCN